MPNTPHKVAQGTARFACLIWLALCGSAALAQDAEPAATPFRATVASGANLSAPGWLEAEFGVQRWATTAPTAVAACRTC